MAGAQVTIVANQIEKQRIGYQALSLTHAADLLEPQIAAGSMVEVAGALYEFAANESITGWGGIAVSSDVYVKVVPAGASITAAFTTTAPTWSTSKQGWYNVAETERYVGGLYKDGAGDYAQKWLYRLSSGGIQNLKEYGDGEIEIVGGLTAAGAIAASGEITANGGDAPLTNSYKAYTTGTINTSYKIPAGHYIFKLSTGALYTTAVEIKIGGSWYIIHNLPINTIVTGCIVSDGSNARFVNSAPFVGATSWYLYRLGA